MSKCDSSGGEFVRLTDFLARVSCELGEGLGGEDDGEVVAASVDDQERARSVDGSDIDGGVRSSGYSREDGEDIETRRRVESRKVGGGAGGRGNGETERLGVVNVVLDAGCGRGDGGGSERLRGEFGVGGGGDRDDGGSVRGVDGISRGSVMRRRGSGRSRSGAGRVEGRSVGGERSRNAGVVGVGLFDGTSFAAEKVVSFRRRISRGEMRTVPALRSQVRRRTLRWGLRSRIWGE